MTPRILIGVTGHRKLDAPAALSEQVHRVLQQILLRKPERVLHALSPLAEGADRIVAQQVLSFPGAELEAILPLAKADYLEDFTTPESRAEFEDLLARAIRVVELKPTGLRNDAYRHAGLYVVDHCDVLVALWDGLPAAGRGGTADIVAYARTCRRELYWINTKNPAREPVHERAARD